MTPMSRAIAAPAARPGLTERVVVPMNAPARPLLSVQNLRKVFHHRDGGKDRDVLAVDDVSFEIFPGETLGLVGESGSGKTTAARCILRATTPTAGRIEFAARDGRVVDLVAAPESALRPLRRELQMIFQDPHASLDPRMTVREIVAEPLVVHHIGSRKEREQRVAAMLERVGLKPEHMDRFPAAFSAGQRQRVGIARALILQPSLIVADEPVSALDVSVQAQVLNLLKDVQLEYRLTYLFVAHNLDVVRHVCDRVAVMRGGKLIEISDTATLFARPQHPYTRELLASGLTEKQSD